MSDLSKRIASLPPAKRELLLKKLGQRPEAAARPRIPRRDPTQPITLSSGQERLWFLEQLEPGSAVYHIAGTLHLHGPLDVGALARSLNEVIRRHEVLRTAIVDVGGAPVATVQAAAEQRLPVRDLRELPPAERPAQVERIAREEAIRPFDLARPPLLRASLLRTEAREHVLVFAMHHIASDGWSGGVLTRELWLLYEAFRSGRPSPLGELPIQYADHVQWQARWLAGGVLERQLGYWRTQLAGLSSALDLPTDAPRPARLSTTGASHPFALSPQLSAAVEALGRREGTTLFMTLLAAFQALLFRYTGQDDVAVGSPIANRQHDETEGLIGFFANTLVLRSRVSGAGSFRELLHQVRETALGAYAHPDVPFDRLVQLLQPERDLARSPLFQVMFVLQDAPLTPLTIGELTAQPRELDTGTAKFDLTLSAWAGGDGIAGTFEYNRDLFTPATIERLGRHYRALLEAVAADPSVRVDSIRLLDAAERRRIVVDWNATERPDPPALLHRRFLAQAARTPDAVAVVFGEESLTYAELARRALALAGHLRRLGVGPDRLVGIYMERSLELILGIYGVLMAGGAYLPLDPSYPPARVAFMLRDARPTVVLAQAQLAEQLPERGAEVLCLDTTPALFAGAGEAQDGGLDPDHLAYCIYTSGSTGQPKGALNTHRGICNRLAWMQDAYRLAPDDCVLQKTPFSFDVSVWELFWPLLEGARLVVAPPGAHQDSAWLVRLIEAHRVTTIHFVPAMLRAFLEEPRLGACASLRRVIASGEALPAELLPRFFARLGAELHNLYGPTEASVDVTAFACPRGATWRSVPIGRPIANTQIHLLDRALEPVPVGVPGELYIGGVGLARGYLDRPALTAARFVPNPFGPPGSRLYRTGDLGRWLPEGDIEFLGRVDHQVKLRGHRIELGEIEAVLGAHPDVRGVAVLCRDDVVPGDRQLVAYVVRRGDPAAAPALRDWAAARLPGYMTPSLFVALDTLPLGPSGKVDRRALPRPERASPVAATRRPEGDLEEVVAAIWSRLLGIEEVGADDDFFACGGHSLLATQVMSQVREALGVDLPLHTLFASPTVAGLGRAIAAARSSSTVPAAGAGALVRIRETGARPPLFCVHPIGGSVLPYFALARALGEDQPLFGLQARGLEEGAEPRRAIEPMAEAYLAEIRALQPRGPYRIAGWSMGGLVAFEMAQQLHRAGEAVAVLALIDSYLLPADARDPDAAELLAEALLAWPSPARDDEADSDEARLQRVLRHAQAIGRAPGQFGLAEARRLVHLHRCHREAMRSYHPVPYPGALSLFLAREGLAGDGGSEGPWSPRATWTALAHEIQVFAVDGGHHTLFDAPQIASIAGALARCLSS